MIYGIPSFKLEKGIVQRRRQLLEEAGVVFHLNTDIGRDVTLAELRARHAAVLLATGVYQAREIAAPGAGLPGIVRRSTTSPPPTARALGDAVPDFESGELNAAGQGRGGDRRRRHRHGLRAHRGPSGRARRSRCLYRRDRANMPGSHARGDECRGGGRGVPLAVGARSVPG